MIRRVFLIVLVLLAGCGDPTLDTSTDDAYAASLRAVSAGLSDDHRRLFEQSVRDVLVGDGIGWDAIGPKSAEQQQIRLASLHGLTGRQVIVKGLTIRRDRQTRLAARMEGLIAATSDPQERARLTRNLDGLRSELAGVERDLAAVR